MPYNSAEAPNPFKDHKGFFVPDVEGGPREIMMSLSPQAQRIEREYAEIVAKRKLEQSNGGIDTTKWVAAVAALVGVGAVFLKLLRA